jgi:hypothetical protein
MKQDETPITERPTLRCPPPLDWKPPKWPVYDKYYRGYEGDDRPTIPVPPHNRD